MKLSAIFDSLEQQKPGRVLEMQNAGGKTAELISQSYSLGAGDAEFTDPQLKADLLEAVEAIKTQYNDTLATIIQRESRISVLSLASSGVVLVAAAGLIFSILGQTRMTDVVTGLIIFIFTLVSSYLVHYRATRGELNDLLRQRIRLTELTPSIFDLLSKVKFGLSYSDDGVGDALDQLNRVTQDLQLIRVSLGLTV